jgi:hypothetical protein
MNKRALTMFALYLFVVLTAAVVLIRTIAQNVARAEAPVPVTAARADLSCDALVTTLEAEIFAWYADAVRHLSDDATRPEPMPGPLREWESARRAGADKCKHNRPAAAKLAHLLNVRRALESNRFLLASRIGQDISALH